MKTTSRELHERAKTLFGEALALRPAERAEFLDSACGGDAELRRRVEELLTSHSPDSIVGVRRDDAPTDRPATSSVSALLGGRYRRPVMLAAALGLVALGLWTHRRVEESLRSIRADELRTVLAADRTAVDVWIREYEAQARQWARDPRLLPHVEALVELGQQREPAAEALRDGPASQAIREITQPWYDESPSNSTIGLFTRDGFLLHASSLTGRQMNEAGAGVGHRVFQGETLFLRPFRQDFVLDVDDEEVARAMFTTMNAPVRNASGDVIAAMYVARQANGPFTEILQAARMGATGETYAFDDEGWMLSESRFTEELKGLGVVRARRENAEVESSQLALQVRDPGGDLLQGHQPELEVGARPLTRLAALAIAARDKQDPERLRGVITEPYRNYRGVEVIGAWQWLPSYGFGIATEMEASEAFAPLRYLQLTFGVLFVVLVGAVSATFASSFSVLRLKRRVRELSKAGPYRLLHPIGMGGMGEVFLAEHSLLRRPTAVKTIRLERLNEANVARFEREVQLASQLEHPNTIAIYDFGRTDDDRLFYAMEYVDGLTLADLVAQSGALRPSRAVYLLRQVCASLTEAHEKGLVHRDIKPQNIMVCGKGGLHDFVKVLDFGLAKPLDESASRDLTAGNEVGGTPLYMAPERLESPDTVDARADVYAVGAVGYFLLSGSPLFRDSGVELLHHVLYSEPEPLPGDVPEPLSELVMACLSKDAAGRPASAHELGERLGSIPGLRTWSADDARAAWVRPAASPSKTTVAP